MWFVGFKPVSLHKEIKSIITVLNLRFKLPKLFGHYFSES